MVSGVVSSGHPLLADGSYSHSALPCASRNAAHDQGVRVLVPQVVPAQVDAPAVSGGRRICSDATG